MNYDHNNVDLIKSLLVPTCVVMVVAVVLVVVVATVAAHMALIQVATDVHIYTP